MSTQDELHKFYGASYDTRDTSLDQYELSGYNLAEGFNPGDRVIHINCGSNPFKGMIPNFRAQDPVNAAAEYVMSLDQYITAYHIDKCNIALVLNGFDNAATSAEQEKNVRDIARLMVKRDAKIFWRTAIDAQYPWTFDEHARLAALIGYEVVGIAMETDTQIYAEWGSLIKSATYMGG